MGVLKSLGFSRKAPNASKPPPINAGEYLAKSKWSRPSHHAGGTSRYPERRIPAWVYYDEIYLVVEGDLYLIPPTPTKTLPEERTLVKTRVWDYEGQRWSDHVVVRPWWELVWVADRPPFPQETPLERWIAATICGIAYPRGSEWGRTGNTKTTHEISNGVLHVKVTGDTHYPIPGGQGDDFPAIVLDFPIPGHLLHTGDTP